MNNDLTNKHDSKDDEDKYQLTLDNNLYDYITNIGGSLGFIATFVIILIVWFTFNALHPFSVDINPYQYVMFNLILAFISLVQGVVINLNQNYKSKLDEIHKYNAKKIKVKLSHHNNIIAKH